MAITRSESKRIIELLGQGGKGWQDAEPIIQETMKRVPPGLAARHAEAARTRARSSVSRLPAPAKRSRNHEGAVDAGARDIVNRRIRSLRVQGYIEQRRYRGKRQLRLKVCPSCHRPYAEG